MTNATFAISIYEHDMLSLMARAPCDIMHSLVACSAVHQHLQHVQSDCATSMQFCSGMTCSSANLRVETWSLGRAF